LISLILLITYQLILRWKSERKASIKRQLTKTGTLSNIFVSRDRIGINKVAKSKYSIFMINLCVALIGSLSAILALCGVANQVFFDKKVLDKFLD